MRNQHMQSNARDDTSSRVGWRTLLVLFVLAGGGGCGDWFEVTDPTAILEEEVNNAEGAGLLRAAALHAMYDAVGESAWMSGLIADEFIVQSPGAPLELLDQRNFIDFQEQSSDVTSYSRWQRVWLTSVPMALAKVRAHALPGAREAHTGDLFAVGGYAALRLAEDFCSGFPLHDVVANKLIYSPPLSTQQALERALVAFDSAAPFAADSSRVLNFVRVGRARTLLALGRIEEAGAAVADVPTSYIREAEYSGTSDPNQPNPLAFTGSNRWGSIRSVADREGGNGLAFVTANDPRTGTTAMGTAGDGTTRLYGISKYSTIGTPIVIASGVEARLVEAEAALKVADSRWLAILNGLRSSEISPALPPLTDPGTPASRVDVLFRERAFWLFATGHRLADLRRLVQHYGRSAETVFPTGAYWNGGTYSTGTSLPFSKNEERASPGITGCATPSN